MYISSSLATFHWGKCSNVWSSTHRNNSQNKQLSGNLSAQRNHAISPSCESLDSKDSYWTTGMTGFYFIYLFFSHKIQYRSYSYFDSLAFRGKCQRELFNLLLFFHFLPVTECSNHPKLFKYSNVNKTELF